MDDFDRGVVLDPCMECGKSCDYHKCAIWGVCNSCWQDLQNPPGFTPSVYVPPEKKELSKDDLELMEILPDHPGARE